MTTNPAIPWTTRSDLSTIDMGGTRGRSFAIKDQVTNEFFRFGELELHILETLKSTVTLADLQASIKVKFGNTISDQEIVSYLNPLRQTICWLLEGWAMAGGYSTSTLASTQAVAGSNSWVCSALNCLAYIRDRYLTYCSRSGVWFSIPLALWHCRRRFF